MSFMVHFAFTEIYYFLKDYTKCFFKIVSLKTFLKCYYYIQAMALSLMDKAE